ncbi:MAG: 50S ribosomal protein L3, partial [Flavobacteriia bacterium]
MWTPKRDICNIYGRIGEKGFQGPVKRHGVSLRSHKSEKTIRGPGNLGAWTGNRSWTVAHAGQTGYHLRTEWNKWVLKIGDNPEEVNRKGGFTLVELLLVMAIIGILAGIIFIAIGPARKRARVTAFKESMKNIT